MSSQNAAGGAKRLTLIAMIFAVSMTFIDQTIVSVAAEKNSTLILPFPVELLRFLEHNTNAPAPARTPDVTPVSDRAALT